MRRRNNAVTCNTSRLHFSRSPHGPHLGCLGDVLGFRGAGDRIVTGDTSAVLGRMMTVMMRRRRRRRRGRRSWASFGRP